MILEQIRSRAASDLQHIILPEGDDPRTLTAAEICTRDRVAKITIIGAEDKIRSLASESGANLNGVDIIDHRKSSDFGRMATLYYDLRRAKGQTLEEAEQTVKDPLYYGNLLVREGKADGSVAGATNTTAHTVAAAIRCIGVRQGFKIVSSFFLMALRDPTMGENGAMIYADCGVVIDPTAAELANKKPDPADGRPLDSRCRTGRALCIDKTSYSLRWVVDGTVRTTLDVRFGAEYTPTREGLFSVYWKDRDHVSDLYGSAMPFSMFFSRGQAVHYSSDFAARGYAGASHGCVNVRDYSALASLFNQVRTGDKVVVYRS